MNAIRATQALNKRELENAVPPSASWHVDYRDTAYVYIGGLPLDLSEGDVVTIFSQYGNPTHLNMIRDKETGKSKGFAFLKYEDQRSCDLAVDNLGGAEVLGRLLRVDHTRYKKKDDEDEDTYRIDRLEAEAAGQENNGKRASDTEDDSGHERRQKKKRKLLKEERELEEMLAIKQDGEEEDPMRDYLIQEKREEVARARQRDDERETRHKHRHHRHRDHDGRDSKHRSRRRNLGGTIKVRLKVDKLIDQANTGLRGLETIQMVGTVIEIVDEVSVHGSEIAGNEIVQIDIVNARARETGKAGDRVIVSDSSKDMVLYCQRFPSI